MKRKPGFLLATLAVMLGTTVCSAATYYVDQNHPSASNSNPGTEALPWLTMSKAASSTAVGPGDMVIVKEGIYRERVTISRSGTPGSPITYQANPGDRVVVAGSSEIAGWTQLTVGLARGNPNYANIYYVDIGYEPTRLDDDEVQLVYARQPDQGWWVVGAGSDPRHIVDTVNLTQPDPGYWVGARLFFINLTPVVNQAVNVIDYVPGTHTVTVDSNIGTSGGDSGPDPGVDLYYMFNKLEFLDHPGEWVTEDIGGGNTRIYVWPADSGDANNHMYEAPTETRHVLSWGTSHDVIIDGFEVRHSTGYGHGLGERNVAGAYNIIVQNCIAHANEYMGIRSTGCDDLIIRNCISTDNAYGISVSGGSNILIEECDVYANTVDGILASWGVNNITLRRNFVHDHFLWGHPDNLQTHHDVNNMWVEDCVILNSGQSHMIEGTTGLHYINTIVAGSGAYMLHGGATNQEIRGCTLAYSGYGLMFLGQTGYDFKNNVFYKGHSNVLWGADSGDAYTSDYNVMYQGPGISGAIIAWNSSWLNFTSYVSASGQDTHSVNADPLFINAPVYFEQMDHYDVPHYTSTRLYMADNSLFLVGDHIEINFDGVVRSVTARGSDGNGEWIEYNPPTDGPVLKSGVVANWKTNTDYALDLRVLPGSPALGGGEGGADCGSTLSIPQFRTGDFDGDGVRDVPLWPPSVVVPEPEILSWKIVTDHGPAGEVETEIGAGYIDSRADGVGKLQLTFNRALDPATVNGSALSIVGQSGGDVSSMIQTISLASGNTVLIVELSGPLPDADRYTLTLGGAVQALGGDEIIGDKSVDLAVLAGDADGSAAVDQADMMAIRNNAGQAVTAGTVGYDVDLSGAVTMADMAALRRLLGNTLP